MIVQTAANGFRMFPTSEHVRRALPDELAARIRQTIGETHLGLRRSDGEETGKKRDCADTNHDGCGDQIEPWCDQMRGDTTAGSEAVVVMAGPR